MRDLSSWSRTHAHRYYRGGPISAEARINERIRVPEVRLIGHDGKQIGIVSRDKALAAAKQVGLDLVEISASARPPVCRILDFGKYMYEQSKRQKENKAKSNSSTKIKTCVGTTPSSCQSRITRET